MQLPLKFYQRDDLLTIAKELLGKWLFTDFEGKLTGGIIIETEAYGGAIDRASHAYGNRRTARTEILFQKGGLAYVHICYGMHHMLNIVVNNSDIPEGILIRALAPRVGIATMAQRRSRKQKTTLHEKHLANGPGSLTQALGITMQQYGHTMTSSPLWVEDRKTRIESHMIVSTSRIGIDYAEEDALLPWRFLLEKPEELS
jgi:DNA-3-methyladenine glycosylase